MRPVFTQDQQGYWQKKQENANPMLQWLWRPHGHSKSILNIMAAGIKCGTEVEVRCDGENEEADLKTLVDLIESGLGE